jgi:hypothetical protein
LEASSEILDQSTASILRAWIRDTLSSAPPLRSRTLAVAGRYDNRIEPDDEIERPEVML